MNFLNRNVSVVVQRGEGIGARWSHPNARLIWIWWPFQRTKYQNTLLGNCTPKFKKIQTPELILTIEYVQIFPFLWPQNSEIDHISWGVTAPSRTTELHSCTPRPPIHFPRTATFGCNTKYYNNGYNYVWFVLNIMKISMHRLNFVWFALNILYTNATAEY